ncbi:MAG TPA: hypothetical protein VN688_02505 [Gemmataceae bacterium]|nr:hypothetical protein [Gemmataceae bacterium]
MRNMLALFATGILTIVGLGWYLGWYKVRSQPASVPGQHSVQIDINTKQIGKDIQRSEQKIQQMIDNKTKEEAASIKKTSDNLMLPSPPSDSKLSTNKGDKAPLFQFNTGKSGPSGEIGGDKGSVIHFGGDNGPTIQFGSDKK